MEKFRFSDSECEKLRKKLKKSLTNESESGKINKHFAER